MRASTIWSVLSLIGIGAFVGGCRSSTKELPSHAVPQGQYEQTYRLAQEKAAFSLDESLEIIQYTAEMAYMQGALGEACRGYLLQAELRETYGTDMTDLRVAVNDYLRAAAICEDAEEPTCAAKAHYHAAQGFMVFTDYEQAIRYFLRAHARFELVQDSIYMLYSLMRLSDAFYEDRSYPEADQFAQQATHLADAMQHDSAMIHLLIRQGEFYLRNHQLEQALGKLRLAAARSQEGQQEYYPRILNRQADVLLQLNRSREAEMPLEQALQLAQAQGDLRATAESLSLMARLALAQAKYDQVVEYLDTSITLADSLGQTSLLLTNYELFVTYHLQTGQLDNLRSHRQRYSRMRDSLAAQERHDLTQRLQAQFEAQQLDDRIKLLETQREIQAVELNNRRLQMRFAVVVGIFLLILAFFFYQQYRQKQQVNGKLEWLVARRTEELRTSNLSLQEANRELDTFAYRTSHDIRGPVARLLGLCQLILQIDNEGDIRRYVELIYRETIQMDFMLHRFLEVNNIKHLDRKAVPISVHSSLQRVLRDLTHLEAAQNVRTILDVKEPISLVADATLFEIILKNLIENAMLFTGGQVSSPCVEIEATTIGESVSIRVRDNGIGISPKVAPHIFEMFYRGTNVSKGLGLGLYATQLALQAMGGQVHFTSIPGERTEFVVSLPERPAKPTEKTREEEDL